ALRLSLSSKATTRGGRLNSMHLPRLRSRSRTEYVLIDAVRLENRSGQMAAAKQLKAAIVARRAPNGRRGTRTRPEPEQDTDADLERARDRVAAAERRIDNDHTS